MFKYTATTTTTTTTTRTTNQQQEQYLQFIVNINVDVNININTNFKTLWLTFIQPLQQEITSNKTLSGIPQSTTTSSYIKIIVNDTSSNEYCQ